MFGLELHIGRGKGKSEMNVNRPECIEQNTMSDHTVEKLTGHISGMAAERIKYAEQSG